MGSSTKGRKFSPQVLTHAEVCRLLAVSRPCLTGRRNRALIAVMYRAGLRVSEALALYPRDLDERAGTVYVERGKGGKSRLVGMDAGAFALVGRWLDLRERKRGIGPRRLLFCTLSGGALSQAYVRQMLARLGRRAGIEKRVHSHAFRHTFASQLLDEGRDVATISKLLGHASIATTAVYLDHVNPKAAVEAASRRVWELGRLAR